MVIKLEGPPSREPDAQPPVEPSAWVARTLSRPLARRGFLLRAAAVGITATAAPSLLAACEQLGSPTVEPMATPFPPPTPFDAGAVTPSPTATATPTPAPAATATPVPMATATATPHPSPTPTPKPSLDTQSARISHLLRRAGFGANKGELASFRRAGLQATIDYMVDFDSVDDSALEERLAAQELNFDRLGALQLWWLQRMAYSLRPLQEKVTLFWHGILTSSFRKSGAGPVHIQNQLYRKMGMGRYDEMLKVVSRDPAMLIYLDSRVNRKGAPNENYSRELMELFTLGIGNYSEEDVRESARAFTGWQIRRGNEFLFNQRQHDFGDKTFLGQTGAWDGDDVVDIIMQQPAAGEYIVRRLWEFFAYPDPEPAVIDRLAAVFRDSATEIRPVVRAILESDEFYSSRAVKALVKSPAELVASSIRTLSIDTTGAPLRRRIEAMGQELFAPPDVSGWEGGAAWINSSTLFERVNFANAVASARGKRLAFDPEALFSDTPDVPSSLVDFCVDLLLAGEVSDETRHLFVEYVAALRTTPAHVPRDEQLRGLVYLVLASPDYQLA
jgi:uncharacterized protein (DUF1800 family)